MISVPLVVVFSHQQQLSSAGHLQEASKQFQYCFKQYASSNLLEYRKNIMLYLKKLKLTSAAPV